MAVKRAFKKFERPGQGKPGNIQIRDLMTVLTNEGSKDKRLTKERALEVIKKVCRFRFMFDITCAS
jgi:Ca2+-binding EF-hand superfamily protein